MPDEQTMEPREILATCLRQSYYGDESVLDADVERCFAALEAAGYVVIEADRFDRVQRASAAAIGEEARYHGGMIEDARVALGLQPGDLAPLPVQEKSAAE
jgi:hypothetical protein